MNLSRFSLKKFYIFLVIPIFLPLLFFTLYKYYFKDSVKVENEVLSEVINHPSQFISLGEEFVFIPKFSPYNENLLLELVESPEWLEMDDGVISGMSEEEGTYKFVLRLWEGNVFYEQEYYLVITDDLDE